MVLELASLLSCLLWLEVNAPFSFKAATASTTLVPGGNDLGQAVPSTQSAHCDVSWLIADLLPQPASLHCLWPAWASLGLLEFAWLACKAAALLRSSSQSKTKASRLRDLSAFVCNAATQCAEARINSMNKKKDCIGKHLLNILELLSLKCVNLKPQKVFLFCFSWKVIYVISV